jgi:hypothetical protein
MQEIPFTDYADTHFLLFLSISEVRDSGIIFRFFRCIAFYSISSPIVLPWTLS